MGPRLFVDTSAWMAMADAADPRHLATRHARDAWLHAGGILVSSDYVLDETLTLIRMRLALDAAQAWWRQVEHSPRLQWEPIDPERARRARDWFFRWSDKRLSFTDCTSFVLMQELGITQALTLDQHFVQAGFSKLP